MRLLLVLVLIAPMAFAQEIQPLIGKWGTDAQCSGSLITPKGTKRAAPFDVRTDWLEYGDVFCRLNWTSAQSTADGTRAIARAICGEDTQRDYLISFNLSGDTLTLVWDLVFQNGPMGRCL